MTQVICADRLEKKHAELLGYAVSMLANWSGKEALLLADGGKELPSARRGERVLALRQGDAASLTRRGGSAFELSYMNAEAKAPRAAILAAAASAGHPIAADTGSLALLTLAEKVAASTIPVLIEGPTGTGKEVLARFLHNNSDRANGPFVAVNCAAMPETMLEAMLFGHCKGAYTGASEAGEGFFRAADRGTLLLDELGEMPLGLQAKLLRALQEGEVVPLGATQPVKVDVRVVACTNRDLPTEIAAGRFREDLYYRLNVFPLRIAALRERRDDIAPLAFAMLLRHCADQSRPMWIAEDALAKLEDHNWPGNVRELENVIRRALLLADDASNLSAAHIVFDNAVSSVATGSTPSVNGPSTGTSTSTGTGKLSNIVRHSEANAILATLQRHDGNRIAAAKSLGISERTLRYRLASMREAGLAVAGGRR